MSVAVVPTRVKGSSRSASCAFRESPTTTTSSRSSTSRASWSGSSSGPRISRAPISSSCPGRRRRSPTSPGCARAGLLPPSRPPRGVRGAHPRDLRRVPDPRRRNRRSRGGRVERRVSSRGGSPSSLSGSTLGRRSARRKFVRAARGPHFLATDGDVLGYEIHMGRIERLGGAPGAFSLEQRNGVPCAGRRWGDLGRRPRGRYDDPWLVRERRRAPSSRCRAPSRAGVDWDHGSRFTVETRRARRVRPARRRSWQQRSNGSFARHRGGLKRGARASVGHGQAFSSCPLPRRRRLRVISCVDGVEVPPLPTRPLVRLSPASWERA